LEIFPRCLLKGEPCPGLVRLTAIMRDKHEGEKAMTEKEIVMEVKATVQRYIEKGEAVSVNQIVQLILDAHPIEGEDAQWFKECADLFIRDTLERLYGLKAEGALEHAEELRQYSKQKQKDERKKNSGLKSL
jgi:hypothetical protein